MSDAFKVAQLTVRGGIGQPGLLEELLHCVLRGLQSFIRQNLLTLPPDYRLAFRELGLSIGLKAAPKLQRIIEEHPASFPDKHILALQIESLLEYTTLAETIESFWMEPENRRGGVWIEHREINMVMLATDLAPDGYLLL